MYFCTFGYLTGDYNPTLYKKWVKAKTQYNAKAYKSVEFDCRLVQSNCHLEGCGKMEPKVPKVPQRFSFTDRDVSFYSTENLEKFANTEITDSVTLRLYNMDVVFNKALEKVIPIVKDPETSQLNIPGLICYRSENFGSPDPNQKVDTFSWLLKQLISERYKMFKQFKKETTVFDEFENFNSYVKAEDTHVDLCVYKKLLECLPDISKSNLPFQNLGIKDYSYYFMLKDYFTLVLRKDGLSLEQMDKGLTKFLKVKPVFNSFEHEYINLLYGKPCSIPNMPQTAEQMGAFVQNMEFLSNMGILGAYCRLPADCLDYLVHLWF